MPNATTDSASGAHAGANAEPNPGAGIRPGEPGRLGVRLDGGGVNVAVFAPRASDVWLCLETADGEQRLRLPGHDHGVWHAHVPGVAAGQRYGLRADGPWDPDAGLVCHPDKFLLDPYALAIDGDVTPDERLRSLDDGGAPVVGDTADVMPRCVVVDESFDWGDDSPPRTPWPDTVVYEAHVRGLTHDLPSVPPPLRGTYAGLAHPAAIDYLTGLGITALELLPVHQFVSEPALTRRGLTNYWGYNSVGFFAPHGSYAASIAPGGQVAEFKRLVRALHAAGIEVILDVVFNHTAEGRLTGPGAGPTLALRGLDDAAYYRRDAAGEYFDVTGCGNTVAADQGPGMRLIMDSLRYWVREMHVDGFRFDLAPALAHSPDGVDTQAGLIHAIGQDPLLRHVKLIAEPWDATAAGYQVGGFPRPWAEWNDHFRDGLRDFWRGHGDVRTLATRISGSSDIFEHRDPQASVNFVTSHDGFTLRDLVSYAGKHNEANGEGNRDGTDDNRSDNLGAEGDVDDPAITAARVRRAANLLASLLLSTGVPMLTAGDERGRTQRGNNNAYCLDDEISWVDWSDPGPWSGLTDLTRIVIGLRQRFPALRPTAHFTGEPRGGGAAKDLTWLHPAGHEMTLDDWHDGGLRTLGACLTDADDAAALMIWMSAAEGEHEVTLSASTGQAFRTLVRTDEPAWGVRAAPEVRAPGALAVHGPAVIVLEVEPGAASG